MELIICNEDAVTNRIHVFNTDVCPYMHWSTIQTTKTRCHSMCVWGGLSIYWNDRTILQCLYRNTYTSMGHSMCALFSKQLSLRHNSWNLLYVFPFFIKAYHPRYQYRTPHPIFTYKISLKATSIWIKREMQILWISVRWVSPQSSSWSIAPWQNTTIRIVVF